MLEEINQQMLREQGFPDAFECPMPLEHRGRRPETFELSTGEIMVYDDVESDEWISGVPWGEL